MEHKDSLPCSQRPPLVPILSQINPVHTKTSCPSKIRLYHLASATWRNFSLCTLSYISPVSVRFQRYHQMNMRWFTNNCLSLFWQKPNTKYTTQYNAKLSLFAFNLNQVAVMTAQCSADHWKWRFCLFITFYSNKTNSVWFSSIRLITKWTKIKSTVLSLKAISFGWCTSFRTFRQNSTLSQTCAAHISIYISSFRKS
jgi:hypothetical protein